MDVTGEVTTEEVTVVVTTGDGRDDVTVVDRTGVDNTVEEMVGDKGVVPTEEEREDVPVVVKRGVEGTEDVPVVVKKGVVEREVVVEVDSTGRVVTEVDVEEVLMEGDLKVFPMEESIVVGVKVVGGQVSRAFKVSLDLVVTKDEDTENQDGVAVEW